MSYGVVFASNPKFEYRNPKQIRSPNVPMSETTYETVEKPASERLMENAQMQGFRNRGPAPKEWGLSRAKRK